MADPTSTPVVNVPAATPTVGAILGAVVSTAVAPKVGADPMTQGAVASVITGLFTWLFHFAHSKLGTPE